MVRRSVLFAATLIFLPFLVSAEQRKALPDYVIAEYGVPPVIPSGSLDPIMAEALDDLVVIALNQSAWSPDDKAAFDVIAKSNDSRVIWTLTDMQRFSWRLEFHDALTQSVEDILQISFDDGQHREAIINRMIAWDIPAYPNYLEHKRSIFTNYIPGWEKLFVEGEIDWQLVDWGGVDIDARPYDATDDICHCIPAIDNPEVSSADAATWLADDDIIFGVEINGEARAYPRQIMEVREMVNDTLGGRDIALPYCSLCGAAQAYFTDRMPNGVTRPVLRTSGLLIRSNKVMYDVETNSLFDTFLGTAVTGPLADLDVVLPPVTVITSTWGAWRDAFPETTVLVEELALGRDYNLRETRDARGPIFPIGDVDPRLPVQEDVVGVISSTGQPIAFPRSSAIAALKDGRSVEHSDVTLVLFADGLRALTADGQQVPSHEAYWFAWSQFYDDTIVWRGE